MYLPKKEADGKNYVKYQVIGASNVSVPTHFYKVILCETNNNKLELEVYVMPNQVIDNETPLKVFQVSFNILDYFVIKLLISNFILGPIGICRKGIGITLLR